MPITFEFSSYHGSGEGPELVAFDFIPIKGSQVWTANLTEKECDVKKKMVDCYKSQKAMASLFSVKAERFRISPNYNFQVKPQSGPLYYEYFDWGITGVQWRRLASEAILLMKIGK